MAGALCRCDREGMKVKKMIAGLVILAALIVCFFVLKKHNEDAAAESAAAEETESVSIDGIPDVNDVSTITVTNTNGDFLLTKAQSGSWQVLGTDMKTDSDKVDQKLDDLAGAKADQAITGVTDFDQFGLSEPQMIINLMSTDGTTTTVNVGDENPVTSQYYIRINDSDTVYAAGSTIYTAFNFTNEDLKAAEETETATAAEETATATE